MRLSRNLKTGYMEAMIERDFVEIDSVIYDDLLHQRARSAEVDNPLFWLNSPHRGVYVNGVERWREFVTSEQSLPLQDKICSLCQRRGRDPRYISSARISWCQFCKQVEVCLHNGHLKGRPNPAGEVFGYSRACNRCYDPTLSKYPPLYIDRANAELPIVRSYMDMASIGLPRRVVSLYLCTVFNDHEYPSPTSRTITKIAIVEKVAHPSVRGAGSRVQILNYYEMVSNDFYILEQVLNEQDVPWMRAVEKEYTLVGGMTASSTEKDKLR